MKFRIFRYDPDKDAKPYMKEYDVELEPTDRMLLDVLPLILVEPGQIRRPGGVTAGLPVHRRHARPGYRRTP